MLGNGLSAPYFLKGCLDFHQTCADMLLGHEKELIRISHLKTIYKRNITIF